MKSDLPFRPGDHVIAYLRDSGHENQEASVQQQAAELLQFCLQHALILDKSYQDEAREGSSDETRQQLAAMMNDLRHGLSVVGVLVWSSSRFARNSIHAQFYRAEIRKLGYLFYSITGQNIEGPEAIIFEALDDYKNERFLADLSIDVKRGLRSLIKEHGCVPGVAPTGFLREPVIIGTHRDGKQRLAHRWIPNPLLIAPIRQAFEMRAAGASLNQINAATHLFNSIHSYQTFWCNQIYLGTLIYGDTVIPNYCEPIIDKATWDAVQLIQKNYARHRNMTGDNPRHPRRVNSEYLLSGLGYCARCGSPLFGRFHTQKNGTKTTSYYCTQAYSKHTCDKTRIPGKTIETAILQTLKETYLKPEYLQDIWQTLRDQHAAYLTDHRENRRQLTAELGELRRQITNLSNAIADTGHSRTLLTRLSDLEERETGLLIKLAALDNLELDDIPPANPARAEQLIHLLDVVFPVSEIQRKRQIMRTLVQRIDVDRDGRRLFGTITVYYPPEPPPDSFAPGDTFTRGKNNVRISPSPSGSPRYTHSFDFTYSITGLSGRHKIVLLF